MKAPTKSQEQIKAERKAEFKAAGFVYLAIIVSFLSVCTVAVVITSQTEAAKTGFRPITTAAPMSFIDKTYMDPKLAHHKTDKPN